MPHIAVLSHPVRSLSFTLFLILLLMTGRLQSPAAQPLIPDPPVPSSLPTPGFIDQNLTASHEEPDLQPLINRVLGNVLYYQFQNSNYYVSVQDAEPAYDNFDSDAADDFIVPAEGWSIGGLYVTGGFNANGFTPTTTVDVTFYADDAGLPGTIQCAVNDVLPVSFAGGDILLKLPVTCDLPGGHYWFSAVPNLDLNPNGQWAWEWNLTQSNHPSVYRNPGNGYNTGCTTWIALQNCFTNWGPDLSFVLYAPLLPPTLTPTLTPTSTLTPTLTPTSTLTPTATEIPSIELLLNGDFEEDSDSNKIPDGWTQKLPTGDKRSCNKPDKIIAYTGNCAYQFKSAPGEKSQLRQDIDLSQLLPIEPDAGDILTLRGYSLASGTVNARISFRVVYSAGEKIKIKTALSNPTDVYTAFISQPLTLIDDVSQIRVQLKNLGTSGKVRFDTLTLGLNNLIAPIGLP